MDPIGLTTMDISSLKSDLISKYAMLPMLFIENLLYLPMNTYLLWVWFIKEKRATMVDKHLCLQRGIATIYCAGTVVDYYFRLYGVSLSFMSSANYCTCWQFFYRVTGNAAQISHFCTALIRFICVKYPIEFHNR